MDRIEEGEVSGTLSDSDQRNWSRKFVIIYISPFPNNKDVSKCCQLSSRHISLIDF